MSPGEAMTPEDRLAAAAIAAVPDWRGASVAFRDVTAPVMSPMHRNVDSLCFVVDVDANSFFLKIAHPDMRGLRPVQRTFAAAAVAAGQGVSPQPLHCLPDHDALVFAYLGDAWRTARVDDLRAPATMASTIAAKKRLPSQPKLGHSWSIFDGIRSVAPAAAARRADDTATPHGMIEAAHNIEAAFAAAGFDQAPCHADGLASNIMLGPNGTICLVDFDSACDTDPLYDLGILLNEAYVFDEEMAPALEVFAGRVQQAMLHRCRLYAIADALFWGLWANGMAATTSRPSIEFLKYAQWRLLRCRTALLDPRFERMLRMI